MVQPGRIATCLWYDGAAEEAAHFYAGLFDDARVLSPVRDAETRAASSPPLMVIFEIRGQRFMGLNGGPQHPQTQACSIFVECEDQAEVDRYWDALVSDGGEESRCGWCKDRFGVSWQVIPKELPALVGDPDRRRAARATEAMLQMRKIDLDALRAAHQG